MLKSFLNISIGLSVAPDNKLIQMRFYLYFQFYLFFFFFVFFFFPVQNIVSEIHVDGKTLTLIQNRRAVQ